MKAGWLKTMTKGKGRLIRKITSIMREPAFPDRLFNSFWIAILLFCVFAFWGKSYDDVFLAFRYARNLEAGHGFVFNTGEDVLSTPAPLFVLLLVFVHKFLPFITIPQAGSLISGIGLAVSALLLYQFGKLSGKRRIGFIAAVLLVTDPFLLLAMGGETPLYVAMVLGAIYLFVTEKFVLSGVLLGLAFLNRTEALVPIAILLLIYIFDRKILPFRFGLAALLTASPWLIFSTLRFGSPLTNSFGAKISQVSAGLPRYPVGLLTWIERLFLNNYPWLAVAVPVVLVGLVVVLFNAHRSWRIVIAWTIGQSFLYAVLPIPFYHWYAAQYGVMASVLVGLGLVQGPDLIARFIGGWNSRKSMARVWRRIIIGLVAVSALALAAVHLQSTNRYVRDWPHGPANRLYENAGTWFKHNTPEDASIAYLEIGAIGFYSNRHIIDTLSLVTPVLSEKVAEMDWLWAYQHFKPDYIIFNRLFNPWIATIFSTDWFERSYVEAARISEPDYAVPLIIYEKVADAQIPDPLVMTVAQNIVQRPVGKITVDRPVSQTFISRAETFSAFELRFATYGPMNRADVVVLLSNTEGNVLAEWEIGPESLFDNAWYRFSLPTVANTRGNTYNIHIRSPETDPDDAVSLWHAFKQDAYPSGALTIGNEQQAGDLSFRVFSEEQD